MSACRACGSARLEVLLDLGPQPATNRYPEDPAAEEARWPLALRQCPSCALIQLSEPFPAEEVRPREPWIVYREPEGHLDRLADRLAALAGPGAAAAGVSYKDDPLLERLAARGLKAAWRLDPAKDLGVADPCAGLETLQQRLTPEAARGVARARGRAELVLARHVLEHAYDPRAFVAALLELAAPGGLVAFEVPDCRRALETRDYGAIWEEHVLYFTPETLRRSLPQWGLEEAAFETYPYPMEDSLVAAARARAGAPPAPEAPPKERDLARAFAAGLPAARREFRELLAPHAGRAALFGAGHRAAAFVNLLGLKDLLAFVVDDDPHKRGRRLPGSGLPILGSPALLERKIELCLLCLSPESEAKVARAQGAFVAAGGRLVSVFPASPYAAPGARAR